MGAKIAQTDRFTKKIIYLGVYVSGRLPIRQSVEASPGAVL